MQRFGTRSRPASRASKWWVCWHRLVLALHTALRQRQYRQQQLRRSASSPPADQSRMPPGVDCTMALELTPWASGWSASRAVRPRMSGTHAFAILLPHQCRHNKAERAWILHLLDCHTIIRCAPRCALKTLLQRFGSVQVGWVCVVRFVNFLQRHNSCSLVCAPLVGDVCKASLTFLGVCCGETHDSGGHGAIGALRGSACGDVSAVTR